MKKHITKEKRVVKETFNTEEIDISVERNMNEFARASFVDRFADVRDGLKVIARRLLYAMHSVSVTDTSPMVKSAKIIGDTIGNYHPHGDLAAYGAFVALAQPFTTNYPLIESQGNFGNALGDPPAKYRYTEGRFSAYGRQVIVNELNDEIVEFIPTYDEKLTEPVVLPARVPNLLVNGCFGIGGAAFSFSIPSHNLTDVVNATIALIKKPNILNEELGGMIFPDFPFGGTIINPNAVINYYKYGIPAKIKMVSSYRIDTESRTIHITEFPRFVEGNKLKEDIYTQFAKQKEFGIENVESIFTNGEPDIVISYNKHTNPEKLVSVINDKTKASFSTPLSFSCFINDRLVIDCTIKDMISEWLRFRRSIIKKSIAHKIHKFYRDINILDARIASYEKIDEIVKIAKSSDTKDDIISKLQNTFKFNLLQAAAISEMPIHELSRRSKEELIVRMKKRIDELEIQKKNMSDTAIDKSIIDDLISIEKKFRRPRKTKIVSMEEDTKKQTRAVDKIEFILGRLSNQKEIAFARYDKFLKSTPSPRAAGITRSRHITKFYRYTTGEDILFGISNYGNVYRITAIEEYVLKSTAEQNKWVILPTYQPPRLGEIIVDYFAIAKSEFEIRNGNILIQCSNGTIRKLQLSHIPDRIAKTGSTIIRMKENDGNSNEYAVTVTGAIYLDYSKGNYILYALDTGHVHFFSSNKIPMGSKSTGSIPSNSMGCQIINPHVVKDHGKFIMLKESGATFVGDLSMIQRRSPKQSSDAVWTKARKLIDPIVYIAPYPSICVIACSTEGDIVIYKIDKETKVPEICATPHKVSAFFVL